MAETMKCPECGEEMEEWILEIRNARTGETVSTSRAWICKPCDLVVQKHGRKQ